MRKLMLFSLGFFIACGLGAYAFSVAALLLCGACCLVAAAALLLLRWKRGKAAAVILLGLAVGQLWYVGYDSIYLTPARQLDGTVVSATVELTDFSYDTQYGVGADGKLLLGGRSYAVRLYLDSTDALSPGDRVTGEFYFRYTAPGGQKAQTYHSGNGILLLAYSQDDTQIQYAGSFRAKYLAPYLRRSLLQTVEEIFPGDTAPFIKALLLGDTTGLNYETDTALKLSGIRHVAAVSGLHVSILFSAVYLLLGKRRLTTVLLGVPVLAVFAAMLGFTPSIVRACVMQLLMLLAMLCDKEYDPPTALGFAALCMLAVNPLTVTSVGFQLSVASVAGIFLVSGRLQAWLLEAKRLRRWKGKGKRAKLASAVASSISISLGAMILTAPLSAWYFGSVSLVGVITNLLCLWVVTYLFCGSLIACALYTLYAPLAKGLAWLLAWLARYVLAIAKALSAFPLAAVYTESIYIVAWLVFCYILLGVFLLGKDRRPAVLGCCAALGLCLALLVSWAEPLTDGYRLTVMDVGQGQCILLQSQGRTYMVDCGGDDEETTADTAAQILLSQGITQLDGVILTHYDADHVGGTQYLLGRVDTDVLILPEGDRAELWDEALHEASDAQTIRARENIEIRWGSACITVFSAPEFRSSNESSLCVLFQTEKCDILITADRDKTGELQLLNRENIPQLDVLVVGHHGAPDATGEFLLKATQPSLAVISVGANNTYGHPSEAVLQRLNKYGCVIRRTDLEGTIIIRG